MLRYAMHMTVNIIFVNVEKYSFYIVITSPLFGPRRD